MKVLPIAALTLLLGCRSAQKEETFTITEHNAANGDNQELYVIRHEAGAVVTEIKATCGYTLYDSGPDKKGNSLSGFCPLERLPQVGQSVKHCTPTSQMGTGSPPCMTKTGDFLIVHAGGLWGNDQVSLSVMTESVKR
jgi:hypothetical protein